MTFPTVPRHILKDISHLLCIYSRKRVQSKKLANYELLLSNEFHELNASLIYPGYLIMGTWAISVTSVTRNLASYQTSPLTKEMLILVQNISVNSATKPWATLRRLVNTGWLLIMSNPLARRPWGSLNATSKEYPKFPEFWLTAFFIIIRQLSCDICNKKFINKAMLRSHILNHKSRTETRFICEKCGQKCSSFSVFKKHFKTHTTLPNRNR